MLQSVLKLIDVILRRGLERKKSPLPRGKDSAHHRHGEILHVLEEQSRPALVAGFTNVRRDLKLDVHGFLGSEQIPFLFEKRKKLPEIFKRHFQPPVQNQSWDLPKINDSPGSDSLLVHVR